MRHRKALDLLLKTSRNASTAKAILMKRAKISSVDLHDTRKTQLHQIGEHASRVAEKGIGKQIHLFRV